MFSKKSNRIYRGLSFIGIALLIVALGMSMLCESYRTMLDDFFKTRSTEWVSDGDANTYDFTVDEAYDTTEKLIAGHKDLAVTIQEEGTVLLKNNGTLPLEEGAKITLLGMRSHMPQYGGQLGSAPPETQNVTLEEGLRRQGFEVNPTMVSVYEGLEEDYAPGRMSQSFGVGNNEPIYRVNEPSLENIASVDADYAESFAEYNDAAIVVFGRPGSESADLFPGARGKDPAEGGAENILGLTANEEAILETAKANFDHVVVLINTAVPFEVEEMKQDDGVDAIVWVGFFGNYGSIGIANVLRGKDSDGAFLSPSGRLADTYAVDSTSSPAVQNFGIYQFANAEEIEPGGNGTNYRGNWYLNEAEGIYVGYRYYETRYYDSIVREDSNAKSEVGQFVGEGGWDYAKEVSYSFGYGLSYTDFEYKLDEVAVSKDAKTALVFGTVTNIGSNPGKTPIQIYVQMPYVEGGIEKSAIQLVDFAKTPVLQPEEVYEFEVELDLSYIASYDEKEHQTYVMDGGDYYFAIGNGVHEALNNILAAQGKTVADGMDVDGKEGTVVVCQPYGKAGEVDAETFATSKAGVKIENQFEDVDMNYWLPGSTVYLSRTDWAGTWPKSYTGLSATEEMIYQLRNDTYEIKHDDDMTGITFATGVDNGITFGSMKGAAYDDERWSDFLAQLDLSETLNFVLIAQNILHGIESVEMFDVQVNGDALGLKNGLAAYADRNAPWWGGEDPAEDENAEYQPRDWPLAGVMAATYNKELAYRQGVLLGHDSLYSGVAINWGPCVNVHRMPYYGRSQETYSEDPVVTGRMAANICSGAWTKGCAVSLKHFALNDMETNRAGVAPFTNEQKMREVELRSFQIAFENGALGTMTAFNRIGCTYASAHKGLLTNVLRGEWGFHGYIVTDMINGANYMTAKEAIVAGTSHFDNSRDYTAAGQPWEYMTADNIKNDATMMQALERNVHDTMWLLVNSNAMNGKGQNTRQVWLMTWWRAAYISAIAVSAVLAVVPGALYVVGTVKQKRKEA